ncbi:hypothetical protein D3C81_1911140 [compost metagenome]
MIPLLERIPETIPSETVFSRPSGLPIAYTLSPTSGKAVLKGKNFFGIEPVTAPVLEYEDESAVINTSVVGLS